MQLYCYDWSPLLGLAIGKDGRFVGVDLTPYFGDDGEHHAFVLWRKGQVVGFALVRGRSRLTGEVGVHDMAELFVLRGHRRSGVGYEAARAVFDAFPGRWEVRHRDENADAGHFWRATIARYTGGASTETRGEPATLGWNGTVHRFSSG